MKKLFLIVLLFLSQTLLSQTQLSYISQNRDTLLLPNNDTGELIYESWANVPKLEWPVILFVSEDLIASLNERKKRKNIKN